MLGLRGGGLLETVQEGVSGAFFDEPSSKALARLLARHDDGQYSPAAIRAHAERFSPQAFRSALAAWILAEAAFTWHEDALRTSLSSFSG